MNPAGLAMIEADSLEQVKGAKVSDLIKYTYRAAFIELNRNAFKGKSGKLTFEITGLKGTPRWLESNVVPLLDGTGKPTASLGVTRDVTEYKLHEAELLASNKEKDILIKEIHHRVKNNLQLISSMLYLKILDGSNPESREFMTTIREKIKSVSLIHERLLQTESLNAIDIQDYLQKLLHDIHVTYHRPDLELDIQTNIEKLTFSTDYATSLGQLVNELVINAMKHAFVNAAAGKIVVALHRNGTGDSFTLTIQDNGIGLPSEFDPATAKSYGMQLLQIFVKQLKGTLAISNDPGTSYTIDFKI
jgi:two-component sensor histidine kinase